MQRATLADALIEFVRRVGLHLQVVLTPPKKVAVPVLP
jgi:hypothetical protein